VKAAPVVNFTNETACQGEFATFNDSSSTVQGSLSSWFWRFGTLGASTGNSTLFRFLNPGTVPVTLEVTNSVGCRDSIVKNVTVYPRPIAQFFSSFNCFGQPVTFTNTSSSAQGAIVFQTWDFGNGATSFDVSPTYTYPKGGTYTVKLNVFTEFGCQDSMVTQVVVPNLDFERRFTCLGDSTEFTATTFYPNTTVNTLIWNFGDGNTAAGPSTVKHRYAATGTYRVRLTAVTQNGCTDTLSKLIVVETPPSLTIETAGVACQTAAVRFRAVSPAAATAVYAWNFGDPTSGTNNTSTEAEPEHIFSTGATTYQVTLRFVTANGCELTEALTVNLQPRPTAGFTLPDTLCLDERYTATSTAATPQGSITEHLYTLGDGRFTSLVNPPVRYTVVGTYPFTQVVTNTAGCTDTLRKTLTVVPVPVAGFTVNARSGFSPLRVVFTNTSANATRYVWDMGRYGTFTTQNVTLDSVLKGQLVVRLTAYASSNCFSVFQDTITVDTLVPRTYNIVVESVDTVLRGRNVEVSARIRNASDTVVNSLRIRVRLNEYPELETYWSGRVAAGATFTYTFPVRLAFNPEISHQILCLTADRPNTGVDVNPTDNQLCRSLGNYIYFTQPKPNPTDDLLNIEVVLPRAVRVDVKIYDALGNHVAPSFGFDGIVGSNAYALDVRHLATGIYTVVMEADNARFEARFLKQ
jgi:PKD repeat protein